MQFSFYPEGKLVLYANTRPGFDDQSAGWRERLRIVPFPMDFPAGSPQRIERLHEIIFAEEAPGVFNWMVEGARMWLRDGIGRTAAIEVESAAEFRAQDSLGGFFEEVAALVPDAWVTVDEVFKRYRTWAETEGIQGKALWTKNRLSRELFKRGVIAKKNKVGTKSTAGYLGLALIGEDGEPRPEDIRNRPATQMEIPDHQAPPPEPEPDPPSEDDVSSGRTW
jgi:putative DNA primase/helicase